MDTKQILIDAGVEEELATTLSKSINSQIGKEFVAKEQYNKKAGSISELEQKLEELKNEYDSLAENSKETKKYKEDYDKLVTEYNNYKQEIQTKELNSNKISKLKENLKKEGFNEKIIPLLTKEFSLDEIELEEDNIKNWEELSKGVKEGYKDFISTTELEGVEPNKPPASNPTEADPFLAGFMEE